MVVSVFKFTCTRCDKHPIHSSEVVRINFDLLSTGV